MDDTEFQLQIQVLPKPEAEPIGFDIFDEGSLFQSLFCDEPTGPWAQVLSAEYTAATAIAAAYHSRWLRRSKAATAIQRTFERHAAVRNRAASVLQRCYRVLLLHCRTAAVTAVQRCF